MTPRGVNQHEGAGSPRVWVLTHRWTVIASVYFIGVIVAELSTHESFSGLLILVSILLALEWGPSVVVLASLPLLILALSNDFGVIHGPSDGRLIRSVGVAAGIVIAAYASIYRERQAAVLSSSRAAVEAAREAILPVVPTSIGSFRFSCAYRSATQEALVGGDLYKVMATGLGTRLIVGDVQGKGLKAIATTAAVLGCFREWAPETTLLKELIAKLDARVIDKGAGSFVTAIVATLDEGLGVEIANCGHPSPIHFRNGHVKCGVLPDDRTTPLGLAPDPSLTTLSLVPGDRLLFYTDGLIECRDRSGTWIELDQALLGSLGSDPLEDALGALLGRLEAKGGVFKDDVALILVECAPFACAP